MIGTFRASNHYHVTVFISSSDGEWKGRVPTSWHLFLDGSSAILSPVKVGQIYWETGMGIVGSWVPGHRRQVGSERAMSATTR